MALSFKKSASAKVGNPHAGAAGLAGALGAVIACGLILGANFQKAAWVGVQGWGRPYWWLDYRHGFVRRGLVGEIFQRVVGRLDEAHLPVPVTTVHLTCCAFLAGATLWLLFSALRTRMSAPRALLTAAVGVWIAAAEFWSTLAYNEGYMDALVLALAILAALFIRARLYVAAGIVLFVAPFVHEYFVFLVPFVLVSERLAAPSREAGSDPGAVLSLEETPDAPPLPRHLLILAGVAFAAALIVTFGPSAQATRLEIAAMPMDAHDKEILSTTTLTQTLGQSFSASSSQMFATPGYTLKTYGFFLAPSLVALLALLFWRGGKPGPSLWARAAAGIFPVAALLVAWDVSRLLVMSNLTAGLLFLMVVRDSPARVTDARVSALRPGRMTMALSALLALAGLLYGLAPMAYAYYPPGPVTFYPLKVWPGDGRRVFGLHRLWPYANTVVALQTAPQPQAAAVRAPGLLHALHAALPGVEETREGWTVPSHAADALVLFGPYLRLEAGPQRVTMRLRVSAPRGGCAAFAHGFHPSFTVSRDAGRGVIQTRAPLVVSSDRFDPCSLRLEGKFTVPAGGAAAVETPLYATGSRPFLVDRYTLEPGPSAQAR